ncbi:MAG: hypothetical protein PHD36_05025 [Desulfotomaculaceae bacterium]|nr:hypothetical protein [Desulfotomaculaceae bacterium]
MAKQGKKEFILTASGYEYDKQLSKLSIKVFPALQALIANQHDLIETCQEYAQDKSIFLEAHIAELAEVEETIAKEHAKQLVKREELKKKRQDKEKLNKVSQQAIKTNTPVQKYDEPIDEPIKEEEVLLDEIASTISPGLPSARFATATHKTSIKREEPDIRRIAIGASIKTLEILLGRKLTEQELSVIESQVDAYL